MSVINIIRKLQDKEREIRLLILGLDNAGKTTVLQRILNQDISEISPTVGFNIQTMTYTLGSKQNCQQPSNMSSATTMSSSSSSLSLSPSNHTNYTITLWDIGGQSTIRSFWSNYFTNTDGLIWVIDSTDVSRFDLCVDTLKQVMSQEKLNGASLLILANKQDIPFALSLEQIAQMLQLTSDIDNDDQKEDLKKQYQTHNWFLHGCSALNNVGIIQGFDELINDIVNRLYLIDV